MLTEFSLKMLNRKASSPKNKSSAIIEHLNIQNGMIVGDIGSGGGYFTREFSRRVGEEGQVYAIDVNGKALQYISRNLKKEGVKNVKTIPTHPKGVKLPENVDLFFLRNVFHHLSDQEEYFKNIKGFLKENGRIAIIDYNQKKFGFTGFLGHYTPEKVLLDVMGNAGLYPVEKYEFLQDQLFIIFAKKDD